MDDVELRPWQGAGDTSLMQALASRLWPRGLHPGGLGWAAAGGQLADPIVLALDGVTGDVAGWAGLDRGELLVQVDRARPDVAAALVGWALAAAAGAGVEEVAVAVARDDEVLRAAVQRAGFAAGPNDAALVGPTVGMFLDVAGHHPVLPAGYRVRHVEDRELDARVEVHRAAWHPASLPWPPGTAPEIEPGATSRFDTEFYEQARATWLYDQTLDLVAEAPDGSLAGCCICWWDPATGCAEIEPMGVVPEHRRRGLAGALCHAAAERIAERGGTQVFINTGPGTAYPAPSATYQAAGFVAVERGIVYRRSLA